MGAFRWTFFKQGIPSTAIGGKLATQINFVVVIQIGLVLHRIAGKLEFSTNSSFY